MTEQGRGSNNIWILQAALCGLLYGVGNVFYGVDCSKYGFFGVGFLTLTIFSILICYRLVQACQTKHKLGVWVNKENSNYWKAVSKPAAAAVEQQDDSSHQINGDDYHTVTEPQSETTHVFNWRNLAVVSLT